MGLKPCSKLLSLCVNAPLASRNTVAAMSAYSDVESAVPEGYVAVPKKAVYAGALFVSALFGAGVTHFAGRNTAAATGDAQVEQLLPCSGGVKCREARWWAFHSGKFNSSSTAYHLRASLALGPPRASKLGNTW